MPYRHRWEQVRKKETNHNTRSVDAVGNKTCEDPHNRGPPQAED